MAAIETWAKEGFSKLFESFFNHDAQEDLEFFLFSNNYTPTIACTASDLTEITTGGMTKKDLAAIGWSVSTDGSEVIAHFNSGTGIVFSVTGNVSAYGEAIRGKTSGKIYYVKNFGLKEFVSGNVFTINPLKLKCILVVASS